MLGSRRLLPLSLAAVTIVVFATAVLLVGHQSGPTPWLTQTVPTPSANVASPASMNPPTATPNATASATASPAATPSLLPSPSQGITPRFDVVVFGGTPSGVMAAVAAARAGASVALLEPTQHLGGVIASGLGRTDITSGYRSLVGGLTATFFRGVDAFYKKNRTATGLPWDVEPHVAEALFRTMTADAGVNVFFGRKLRQQAGVVVLGGRIVDLITESGERFTGSVYIDASYEGDLMAQAGVTFTVGRESTAAYGEPLAGVRSVNSGSIWGISAVDPSGGLWPGVSVEPLAATGSADDQVMAYTYRVCLSSDRSNQVPFTAPPGYDRSRYGLLQEWMDQYPSRMSKRLDLSSILVLAKLPNNKADVRGAIAFAMEAPDGAQGYASASYEVRKAISADVYSLDAGLFYYLSHDRAVPTAIRGQMGIWGLCKDEFTDNHNWPPLMYIREARRMVGDYVLTQSDVQTTTTKPDSIGIGSYRIDSHTVQIVDVNGKAYGEGVLNAPTHPYEIPYRSLIPPAGDVTNLIVTVDVSASHVAWSSLRMEPQFMIMGEAGGTAAAMALSSGGDAHAVDVSALQQKLKTAGSVLAIP